MANFFPSMTGLRAFEAAARHRSFTRAAIELNLTQSAVSHQIRKLEELIGSPLFDRLGNEIHLTETGRGYYGVARSTIAEIRVATDRAVRQSQDDALTVGSLGTFAVKCLFPHLSKFTRQNPEVLLRLKILQTMPEADFNDCDVAILYGRGADWPGFVVTRITTEELFPVCSPSLLAGSAKLSSPEDLAEHMIIRTVSPLILRDDWPFWLRLAGVPDLVFEREITCDLLFPSFQIAIEGLGIAMGRSAVVKEDIASGRLVEPFDVRIQSPLGYHVVHPPHPASKDHVERFVRWAKETFGGGLTEDSAVSDGVLAGSG